MGTNRLWPERLGTDRQWGRNNRGDEPFWGRIDLKSFHVGLAVWSRQNFKLISNPVPGPVNQMVGV